MAAAAKPGLRDFDVFALISKWSLEAEGEKNFQSDYSFGSLRTTASRAVHELGRLAHSGHEDAAKALLALLSASVSGFDKLCHATPELFEPIARKRTFWPGLISLISHTQNQNKKLIKLLNLGIDSGLNVSGKQPDWDSPETRAALWLYSTMEIWREGQSPARIKEQRTIWKKTMKELGHPANYKPPKPKPIPTNPRWEEEFRLSDESRKLAKSLEPLNRNNSPDWFEASWPLFISRYRKDFENRKCFTAYWKGDAFAEIDPADPRNKRLKKSARGDIRDAIKKKIKQAFRSIAPKNSKIV